MPAILKKSASSAKTPEKKPAAKSSRSLKPKPSTILRQTQDKSKTIAVSQGKTAAIPAPKRDSVSKPISEPQTTSPTPATAKTEIVPPAVQLGPVPAPVAISLPTPDIHHLPLASISPQSSSITAVVTETPPSKSKPAVSSEDRIIHFKPPIIVKELAARMSIKPFQLISDLMQLKILVSINQPVEPDIARKLCEKHGFKLELERRGEHPVKPAEVPKEEVEKSREPRRATHLVGRPPVVTIMGHVDHGKTSLLDAIRKTNVAAGEAGGITQHIGAYTVTLPGRPGKGDPSAKSSVAPAERTITFLDTPGHEAFTAMRARGANLTDIVVLVVAGDDGLMPQTLEAISHARAASVPIIVALNKMDLEAAQKMKDRVKKQLQEQDLMPEEWGGKTITIEVSAAKKTGIDQLLEMILLQAEIMEIKAEADGPAEGNVIEAQMEAGRGATATVLVRRGVLHVGNPMVIGPHWGKLKALFDDKGQRVKEAGPSMAVKAVGLSATPEAGAPFYVVGSETEAREHSEREHKKLRLQKLEGPKRLTLEDLLTPTADQRKILKLILKTDVQGSCEAIREVLSHLPQDKVQLETIHAAVGPITESDVLLASASKALIIGFQVKVDSAAAEAAKIDGVEIHLFRIIYELANKITEFMSGLLDPETKVVTLGRAEVKQIFSISKGGNVAGCLVTQGRVDRKARVRVVRRKNILFEGAIATLRRFQDDVSEVRLGLECGIQVDGFNDYEVGDGIEIYHLEKTAAKL